MSHATANASRPRRLRAAALLGRGGASSMLRLSRAAGTLPSGAALEGWVTRAAALLEQPSPQPLYTMLAPSAPALPR